MGGGKDSSKMHTDGRINIELTVSSLGRPSGIVRATKRSSMAQFDRGSAARRIASSDSSSAKQGHLSSFSPHFCPSEAISGSSHRSVCILLESLPPPITPAIMKRSHWAEPVLVAQVKFTEWTQDDQLRQPIFLGLRTDKQAKDVVRE